MTGERIDPLNSSGGVSRAGNKSAIVAAAALASRRAQVQLKQTPQTAPGPRPKPQRAPSAASTLSNLSTSSQKTITEKVIEKPSAKDAAKAATWRSDPPRESVVSQQGQQQRPKNPTKNAAAAAASISFAPKGNDPVEKPVVAAAAARTSSLNPVKVEPRAGLQDKLMQALTQNRQTTEDNKSIHSRDLQSQSNTAARLSTKITPKLMTAPAPQQSALAAAALARPQAETKFAEINLNVKERQDRKRKHHYQPAATWSITSPTDALPSSSQVLNVPQRAVGNVRKSISGDRRSDVPSSIDSDKPRKFSQVMHKLGLKKQAPAPAPAPPTSNAHVPPEPSTMRKDKKSKFNEHKPWKHHHDAKMLTEKERKRYERLWAANKGGHIPFSMHEPVHDIYSSQTESVTSLPNSNTSGLPSIPRITVNDEHLDHTSSEYQSEIQDSASMRSFRSSITSDSDHYDPQVDDVSGYVVANIWHRSQLPDDTLAQVWGLVDNNHDGTLDRESFIVGTWLVDQCLYGRKLPPTVSEQIWTSSGRLNVKIRVKQKNHKFRRSHHGHKNKKYSTANAAAILAAKERSSTPQSAM